MSIKTLYNDFYGDETRWWVGVVESVNDPIKQGRIKVRIYGIHSASSEDIPISALPWAQVVAPVTQGGTSGLYGTPVGIQPYAQVFGIFLDGKHSQLPLVLGSIPRVDGEKPSTVAGGRGAPATAPPGTTDASGNPLPERDPAQGGTSPDAADPRGEAARTNTGTGATANSLPDALDPRREARRTRSIVPTPGVPPKNLGGTTPHGGGSTSGRLEGGSNGEKIFNYLEGVFRLDMKLPNSKELAAGFLGNFYFESGYNPLVENSIGAVGIAQWLGERRTSLIHTANKLGRQLYQTKLLSGADGKYKVPDLQTQLEFVIDELQNVRWLGFDKWAPTCTTAKKAADRVEAFYEISEFSNEIWKGETKWKYAPYETRLNSGRGSVANYTERLKKAEEVYNSFVIINKSSGNVS